MGYKANFVHPYSFIQHPCKNMSFFVFLIREFPTKWKDEKRLRIAYIFKIHLYIASASVLFVSLCVPISFLREPFLINPTTFVLLWLISGMGAYSSYCHIAWILRIKVIMLLLLLNFLLLLYCFIFCCLRSSPSVATSL